jgi:hypothetical protein
MASAASDEETLLTDRSRREDIPRLRQQWYEKYKDIIQGVPEKLPPWREVNHEIELIDEGKVYRYHPPRCPESLRPELWEKVNQYVRADWWRAQASKQAAPLLCLSKKTGRLRTAVDLCQRNDNTVKDITPLPDMDGIRHDVARARWRSKIDLSNAYEQVRMNLRTSTRRRLQPSRVPT